MGLKRLRKTSKYKNVKTRYNGNIFDSKIEANYCKYLDVLKKSKLIMGYERQVKIPILVREKFYSRHGCNSLEADLEGMGLSNYHCYGTVGHCTKGKRYYLVNVDGYYLCNFVCNYIADFVVTYPNGNISIMDVKGYKTSIYKLKKKLIKIIYGIDIIEITKDDI